MDKTLFQNISEGVERQQMLLDNADGVPGHRGNRGIVQESRPASNKEGGIIEWLNHK